MHNSDSIMSGGRCHSATPLGSAYIISKPTTWAEYISPHNWANYSTHRGIWNEYHFMSPCRAQSPERENVSFGLVQRFFFGVQPDPSVCLCDCPRGTALWSSWHQNRALDQYTAYVPSKGRVLWMWGYMICGGPDLILEFRAFQLTLLSVSEWLHELVTNKEWIRKCE